jgi:hypothetical protein
MTTPPRSYSSAEVLLEIQKLVLVYLDHCAEILQLCVVAKNCQELPREEGGCWHRHNIL